jgi:glycosyltransferase involved in cell wall biosynthesis
VTARPRVTVLTTVFNGERFLDEAIASVLSQDVREIEYVIVDDGSRDRTGSIIAKWASRDSRVAFMQLPENRGVGYAANRGLELARGEYVARLDADDITLPGRFAAQMAMLDRNPEVALVSTQYELIDARGTIRGAITSREPPPVLSFLLNFTNPLGAHSPAMFRREAARAIGGYDETHQPCADYDFIARIGTIAILPIIGVRYRVHDAQITSRLRARQRALILEIAQHRLSSFLDRHVSFDEINAARSVFGRSEAPTSADAAQRILEEAFDRFCALHPSLSRRVAAITARRWLRSVRRETEKTKRLRYAMKWKLRQ